MFLLVRPAVLAMMSALALLTPPATAVDTAQQWRGDLRGYASQDYRIKGRAGQSLMLRLHTRHGATYFNLLPPGSSAEAMFNGQFGDNRFDGVLPDDGEYVVRVYMLRAAARRQERARYSLDVVQRGTALPALASSQDRLVKGTAYHAQARIACTPPYAEAQQCMAGVIRRGHDGTATVVIDWPGEGRRRILFVAGRPLASDAMAPLQAMRRANDSTEVQFDMERYDVPDALLTGG